MNEKNEKELNKNFQYSAVRTDLAIEAREMIHEGEDDELSGVEVDEDFIEAINLKITKVMILNEQGSQIMNKPIGNYITMECSGIKENESEIHEKLIFQLANQLKQLINTKDNPVILVVGLYWVRWWALNPSKLPLEEFSNRVE